MSNSDSSLHINNLGETDMTQHILDAETKKNLLGYLPFGSDQTVDCIIDTVPDKDLQPVFSVRGLKQAEKVQIQSDAMNLALSGNMMREPGLSMDDKIKAKEEYLKILEAHRTRSNEITRACVEGWVNLKDTNKAEIKFKADPKGGADISIFESLPEDYRLTLTRFIKEISGLNSFEALSLR